MRDVLRRLRGRLPGWCPVVLDRDLGASWRATCRRELAEADLVVCVAGPAAAGNENVRWELRTARALGKEVVAYRASDRLAALSEGRTVDTLDELAWALQESRFRPLGS